jgi:hypothetical protein
LFPADLEDNHINGLKSGRWSGLTVLEVNIEHVFAKWRIKFNQPPTTNHIYNSLPTKNKVFVLSNKVLQR